VVWLLRARRGEAPRNEPGEGWSMTPAAGGMALAGEAGGGRRWRALVAGPGQAAVTDGGESLTGRLAVWMAGETPTAGGPLAAVSGASALVTASASWSSGAAPVTGVVSSHPAAPLARPGAPPSGSPEDPTW